MKTSDWRQAWEDSDIEDWDRRILCALSCSMGGDGGQSTNCSPGFARIGKRSGYKPQRVKELITGSKKINKETGEVRIRLGLEARGWFNIGRLPGMTNRYFAAIPAGCPECGSQRITVEVADGAEVRVCANRHVWEVSPPT